MTEFALLLIVVLAGLNLLVAIASWRRHDVLASHHGELARSHHLLALEVAGIKTVQANALSAKECRELFESQAHLCGRMDTAVKLMQTIQEHLMERDR